MIQRGLAAGEGFVQRMGARAQFFASGVLFGLLAVMTRSATLGGFSAAQITAVRFGAGLAFTVALFVARPGTYAPVRYRLLASRGLLGGLAAFLYFVALSRIPAGEATLLNNTFPVFAIAISYFTLRERPTFHLAIGLAIAGSGVFLVLGGGSASFSLGWGELAGIASAMLGGAAVTAIRALRATDNAPTIFFAFCLGGLVVSWPFAMGSWPRAPWLWLLALGVGAVSFAAQLLMTHAYGALTVPEAAIWQQLTPVASYLWALGVLDERLSGLGALGVALGIIGVIYGSVLGQRQPGPAKRNGSEVRPA